MNRFPKLLLLVVALLVTACGENPFDPESRERPEYAIFSADLAVGDFSYAPSAETTLELNATLNPGYNARGQLRQVQRGPIVGGDTLQPTGPSSRGSLIYRRIQSTDWAALADTVITITPPAVAGLTPSPALIELAPWARADTGAIRITTGEDVVLRLRAPSRVANGATPGWTLQIASSTGITTSVSGTSAPPEAIRIPAELLPGTGPRELRAILGLFQTGTQPSYPLRAGEYEAGVVLRTTIAWQIEIITRP